MTIALLLVSMALMLAAIVISILANTLKDAMEQNERILKRLEDYRRELQRKQ